MCLCFAWNETESCKNSSDGHLNLIHAVLTTLALTTLSTSLKNDSHFSVLWSLALLWLTLFRLDLHLSLPAWIQRRSLTLILDLFFLRPLSLLCFLLFFLLITELHSLLIIQEHELVPPQVTKSYMFSFCSRKTLSIIILMGACCFGSTTTPKPTQRIKETFNTRASTTVLNELQQEQQRKKKMEISYVNNDPKAFLKNPILQPYTSKFH